MRGYSQTAVREHAGDFVSINLGPIKRSGDAIPMEMSSYQFGGTLSRAKFNNMKLGDVLVRLDEAPVTGVLASFRARIRVLRIGRQIRGNIRGRGTRRDGDARTAAELHFREQLGR